MLALRIALAELCYMWKPVEHWNSTNEVRPSVIDTYSDLSSCKEAQLHKWSPNEITSKAPQNNVAVDNDQGSKAPICSD